MSKNGILVISSSSLHTFVECRKSYSLTWLLGLEPNHDNEAIERGTSLHEHAAAFADYWHNKDSASWSTYEQKNRSNEMFSVFQKYRKAQWDIQPEEIMLAAADKTRREHPLYMPLVKSGGWDIWIRFTLDLAYRRDDWLHIRDYKTFSQYPSSLNSELDFQGRGSIAMAQRYFKDNRVLFEWEYIRSVAPGSPRGKGPWEWDGSKWFKETTNRKTGKGEREYAEVWLPEECYTRETLVCSRSESDEMWLELQNAARDLVRCMREERWYRSPRRGTMPYTCHTCLAKHLCKAQMALGTLDQETIDMLATPRTPIQVPYSDYMRFRKVPKDGLLPAGVIARG